MVTIITDRTELDVLNGTSKGVYNYTDLNRVESAVKELYTQLKVYMPAIDDIITKIDWAPFEPDVEYLSINNNWFTKEQRERYLTNVQKLAIMVVIADKINLPTSMDNLDYIGANNIEKAIGIIEKAIESIPINWRYCGTFQCGEE